MSRCEQELCQMWNGDTCVCAAMDGDPDAIQDLADWVDEMASLGGTE